MTSIESQNAEVMEPTMASTKNDNDITITSNMNQIPELSEYEFSRAAVEGLGNRVRVTDTDETTGLELFCYVRCGPEDGRLIRECRGVVFHENEIVMRAFPYTVEYSHDDLEGVSSDIGPVFSECKFYTSEEGALIRMFFYGGKWYTSTHRKLNAFRSKWSSRESFGTSFKRALEVEIQNNENLRNAMGNGNVNDGNSMLERFQNILDKTKQYMFLIRHNEENRIVCAAPLVPKLYHVGTFVKGELVMTENIYIPYPQEHFFSNIDSLIEYVSHINIREHQGLIAFAPNNKQIKILHQDYLELFRARGNEPSIKYRYLQVRMNSRMVDMLYHLYPEMAQVFDEYENILYAIARKIHSSYVKRHIKNKWSTLPTEEYNVDRACHAWHEEDRKNNRVSLEKIVEILNEQNATNLNKMIRRHIEEQQQQKETQNNVKVRNRSNTISSANASPTCGASSPPTSASPLLLSKNRMHNPVLPDLPMLEPKQVNMPPITKISVSCD